MMVYRSVGEIPVGIVSVVAVGLFDGLHLGHLTVIERALSIARSKKLDTIVLTFDITESAHPSAKRTDNRLLTPTSFESTLGGMGVGAVVRLSFESIRMLTDREFAQGILVDLLGAQAVCCGENFRFGRGAAGDIAALHRFGEELGFSTEVLPLASYQREIISSTRIRACVEKGELEAAAAMLGRPYSFDFAAVFLDDNTLMQELPQGYVEPPAGRYSSTVNINGQRFPAFSRIFASDSGILLCETRTEAPIANLSGASPVIELISYL